MTKPLIIPSPAGGGAGAARGAASSEEDVVFKIKLFILRLQFADSVPPLESSMSIARASVSPLRFRRHMASSTTISAAVLRSCVLITD